MAVEKLFLNTRTFKCPPTDVPKALEVVMRQCDHWADQEENFEESSQTNPHKPYVFDLEPAVRMVADETGKDFSS